MLANGAICARRQVTRNENSPRGWTQWVDEGTSDAVVAGLRQAILGETFDAVPVAPIGTTHQRRLDNFAAARPHSHAIRSASNQLRDECRTQTSK
ncbi:MAG: hypothetical protein K2X57_21775 [Xanthobacteraceae bacterium]|nr:hypothetical protein [Xanthobacteraceae bacterium]